MEFRNNIFGVVIDGVLYSNRIERKLSSKLDNGIYSLNMEADNFLETLTPANLEDARKYFRKSSKIDVVTGISFHDGFIPENPVAYKKIPIKVFDATYDEFEEVEIVFVKGKAYYIQNLHSNKDYVLLELKESFSLKKKINLDNIKGITPEIRIAYMFHLIEQKKKEQEEPVAMVRNLMMESGANVEFVRKNNLGFEVQWSVDEYVINTQLDKNFRVVEAGFCTSSYDKTQSARSVVNLLKDYATKRVSNRDFVNITRNPR
jgi:hypothetical protein